MFLCPIRGKFEHTSSDTTDEIDSPRDWEWEKVGAHGYSPLNR
jgi:hypothetical protein